MSRLHKLDDSVVVEDGVDAMVFSICDDCREAYPGPDYYVFETDGCTTTTTDPVTGVTTEEPHDCTGNLCPDCAEMLEPDDPEDPRKQEIVYKDGQWESTGVKP